MENAKAIKLAQIVPSKMNPRKTVNPNQFTELVASIKEHGVLQPIIVREVSDKERATKTNLYEIVCGERRYQAALRAELQEIPCIVRELSDTEAIEIGVIENLQREDVNAMDEAAGIAALMKTGKNDAKAIASKLGKSETYVTGRMRLLKLPDEVQAAIADATISPAHGLVIARLSDIGDQKKLLAEIKREKLSVRSAENQLSEYGRNLSNAPFDTAECAKCPSNGSKIKDFFDKDTNLKGQCMNPECMTRKTKAWVEQARAEIVKAGGVLLSKAEADKKFGSNWHYGGGNASQLDQRSRKELGKKYKEKCEHCEKHAFILNENEYRNGEVTIAEFCFNERCLRGTAAGTTSPKEQAERSEERNETKTANRCRIVVVQAWRKFAAAKLNQHAINVLACKQVREAVMGYYDGDEVSISKLWEKTDAELAKLTQAGLSELIKDQYGIEEIAELSTSLKFEPTKDLVLDDLYWSALSKTELVALGKKVGAKGITGNEKRDELVKKVRAEIKPGFVPDDIKAFIKKPC